MQPGNHNSKALTASKDTIQKPHVFYKSTSKFFRFIGRLFHRKPTAASTHRVYPVLIHRMHSVSTTISQRPNSSVRYSTLSRRWSLLSYNQIPENEIYTDMDGSPIQDASMEDWVDLYNVPRNQSSTLRLTDRLSRHSSGSITTPSQQSFMCPHEGGGYFQTLLEQVIQEESMLSRKPTRFKPPARKSSLKRNKAVLEAIRSAAAAAAATAATARHSCTSTDELDEFQQVQELIDCHWRREDECAAMKLVPAPNRVSPAVERLGELLESLDLEWEIVKEGHEPLSLMRRSTSIKTTSREISEKQSLFKQEFRRGERVSTRSSVTLYDRTSPSPHQSLQRSVTVSNQGPRITSRDYYSRKMRTHSLLPDSLVLL